MNQKYTSMFASAVVAIAFLAPVAVFAAGPAPVNLGSAGNFAIVSKTGITTTAGTSIVGAIGVSPIGSTGITGFGLTPDSSNTFSTSALVIGKVYAANYAAPTPAYMTAAVSDMQTAYTDAAGRALPTAINLGAGNIGGMTLAPGLYKWSTDVTIPTNVTLSGGPNDVWIFQIAGNLSIASGGSVPAGIKVVLTGGAKASNIFWQVGGVTGATLGTYSTFNGNILSAKQIILQTGAVLNGRALAQTQVTLDANTVAMPATLAPALSPCSNNATSTPFLILTQNISNDPDSGNHGDWAIDAFTEHVSVWLGSDHSTYCANANISNGSFVTTGPLSPEAGGALSAGIHGTFTGGENYIIPGSTPLNSAYGTTSLHVVSLPDSSTAGFSWWVNQVFPSIASTTGSSYANTYSLNYITPHNGTWTDADPASGGDQGDITGALGAYTVTIDKFIDGKAATTTTTTATFPMIETWDALNFSGNNVAYSLSPTGINTPNAYEAITSPAFDESATYTTNEVTGGAVVGADCTTGQPYSIVGYTSGATFADAASAVATTTTPNLSNLTQNEYVIVWNKTCSAVTTNPATAVTLTDATLNGANGGSTATGHSFWVSLAPFVTTSSSIPSGVYSTPDFGAIAANTAFSALLSSLTTMGVPSNLPAVTPNTQYYFAAWSLVGGTWYPGAVLNFMTASTTPSPTPPANACATPTVAPAGYTLRNGASGSASVTLAPSTMFVGKNGNGKITGPDGNYILCLGNGNATVTLGNGNNVIVTGNGNQTITTGTGNQTITTGNGNSAITAGIGTDAITTGNGNSHINAGGGSSVCHVGHGNTTVTGCTL